MAAWESVSRQALIFSRRQTQQSSSVENGATSSPQTTQRPGLRAAGAVSNAGSTPAGFLRFCGFFVAI
jgi:hypothetical protein